MVGRDWDNMLISWEFIAFTWMILLKLKLFLSYYFYPSCQRLSKIDQSIMIHFLRRSLLNVDRLSKYVYTYQIQICIYISNTNTYKCKYVRLYVICYDLECGRLWDWENGRWETEKLRVWEIERPKDWETERAARQRLGNWETGRVRDWETEKFINWETESKFPNLWETARLEDRVIEWLRDWNVWS